MDSIAKTKRTPALSSTACSEISRPPTRRTSPNGIVAKPHRAKKTDTTGAAWKSTRSARTGMKSSLVSILIASASGWKSPKSRRPRIGARLAPTRSCMTADCLRSTQVRSPPRFSTRPMTKATRAKAMPRSTARALTRAPGPLQSRGEADRCGRESSERAVAHPREGRHARSRVRGRGAPHGAAASRGRGRGRRPRGSPSPACASPRGRTARQNRWTRPSTFVQVPSRSTYAALGRTMWARALVRLAVGPWKTTPSTRASASSTSATGQPDSRRSWSNTQRSRSRPARAASRTCRPSAAPARPQPISSAPRVFGDLSAHRSRSSAEPGTRGRHPEVDVAHAQRVPEQALGEPEVLVRHPRGEQHAGGSPGAPPAVAVARSTAASSHDSGRAAALSRSSGRSIRVGASTSPKP